MNGRIIYHTHYTRDLVRANPAWTFVFGDNMERRGYGGQAAACRGEINAIGIPTKWRPGRNTRDYFSDADIHSGAVLLALETAINDAFGVIRGGKTLVIPADGVGTGLAELPTRAPRIHAYITERFKSLLVIAAPDPTREGKPRG